MIDFLLDYLIGLFHLLNEMSPYLLLGLLVAGVLYVYFPKQKVYRYLGNREKLAPLKASLFGIPLPLCSCGVIPTGISIYKNGASKGASVSFLISTPQTGVDSILVTYSLLGLPFALLRPFIALFTGVFGGVLVNKFVRQEESGIKQELKDEGRKDINRNKLRTILTYSFIDFLQDIYKWLIIGILLAGVISMAIPDEFFSKYTGEGVMGMLMMLVLSTPLYVCATASVPIAAALMVKGVSAGAVLVFLMAGPATNVATMVVIYKALGKKTLLWYMVSIVGGAFLFGCLIDTLLPKEWFTLSTGNVEPHIHSTWFWLQTLCSIILIGAMGNIFFRKLLIRKRSKIKNNDMRTVVFVDGMTCNGCKENVEQGIKGLKDVKLVEVNLSNGEVVIEGENVDIKQVEKVIEGLGYSIKK